MYGRAKSHLLTKPPFSLKLILNYTFLILNSGFQEKIDKYNENSESYIISSYYIISLLTMSFFIYKQLKQ